MLIGSFTNSWWKWEQSQSTQGISFSIWIGAGLRNMKVCGEATGMPETCQSIGHQELADRFTMVQQLIGPGQLEQLKEQYGGDDENLPDGEAFADQVQTKLEEMEDSIATSGTWRMLGKLTFWGTFPLVICLLFLLGAARSRAEKTAIVATGGAIASGVLFILAVGFAVKRPDYFDLMQLELGAGYSMSIYILGALVALVGSILIRMDADEEVAPLGTGVAPTIGSYQGNGRREPASSPDAPLCQTCSSPADYNAVVKCHICPKCRTRV